MSETALTDDFPTKKISSVDYFIDPRSPEFQVLLKKQSESVSASSFLAASTDLQEVVSTVKQLLEENNGWVKMSNGLWYFYPINALVFPDHVTSKTMLGEKQIPGIFPAYDLEKLTGLSFPNVIRNEPIYKIYQLIMDLKKRKCSNEEFNVPAFMDSKTQMKFVLPQDFELLKMISGSECPFLSTEQRKNFVFPVLTGLGTGFSFPQELHNAQAEMTKGFSKIIDDIWNKKSLHTLNDKLTFFAENNLGKIGVAKFEKTGKISSLFIPVHRLNPTGVCSSPLSPDEVFVIWCAFDLLPDGIQTEDNLFYRWFNRCKNKPNTFELIDQKLVLKKEFFTSPLPQSLGDEKPDTKILLKFLSDQLLNCDVERAAIMPAYSEKQLFDLDKGHWDLWTENSGTPSSDQCHKYTIPCDFVARNPASDVCLKSKYGVIGIDFGSKSTTVVRFGSKQQTKLMQIGRCDFTRLPQASDYENPTVLQFIDLASFYERYCAQKGRPFTRWSDLTVSHTAADTLKDSDDSSIYATFLTDLKQWVGTPKKLRLHDKTGKELILPPYMEIKDFDPIEVYAYYIGLNINNMHTNSIYLHYELSYSVTYDKPVLDKMLKSFENGLRKSLPESVQNDSELMRSFTVRYGASEPAAYALCALKQYRFAPEDGENIFYGVFDFGGGTTDFDFGIYHCASVEQSDCGYDYVLEHFRPSGDKYLGGENILQLIAFHVFKTNKQILLDKKICFPLPFERENTTFDGEISLISDSPEANMNMHRMMEILRPIWEQDNPENKDKIQKLNEGSIRLTLFNQDGKQETGVELKIDIDFINRIIENRINRGVVNFFTRMIEASKMPEQIGVSNIKELNIFLAGNSCRSTVVKNLFEKAISEFKKNNELISIKLYPPLGHDIPETQDNEPCTIPTGKTGVAFGLIEGRDGGSIFVVDHNKNAHGNIAFKFYVGTVKRGNFNVKLDMETPFMQWIPFLKTGSKSTLEVYYTNLSEAGTGMMPISHADMLPCDVSPEEQGFTLFVRIQDCDTIQYVLAQSLEKISDKKVRTFHLE